MYNMSYRDLYGNGAVSTLEDTIPETEDMAAMGGVEDAPVALIDGQKKGNVWMALIVLFVLMLIFHL